VYRKLLKNGGMGSKEVRASNRREWTDQGKVHPQ
jgi:hypothetical protein